MFNKLIMNIFLNNINIINKYMHIYDISIEINNQIILKLILSGFYLPKILTYYYYL